MTEGRNQGRKIKRGAESQKDRRVARKAGVGRKEKENQRGRETGRREWSGKILSSLFICKMGPGAPTSQGSRNKCVIIGLSKC